MSAVRYFHGLYWKTAEADSIVCQLKSPSDYETGTDSLQSKLDSLCSFNPNSPLRPCMHSVCPSYANMGVCNLPIPG